MTAYKHARRGTALALTVILFALTACAAETSPAPASVPAGAVLSKPSPSPEAPAVELAPLLGTTVPAGSLDHAAISAKIDNHSSARPQVGLERTDIVFEELVEGGITRYLAVWHSDVPNLLGPIRSIRPMDPDIAAPFGGIIFYAGGQPHFVDMMRDTPVYNAIHGQPDTDRSMHRVADRRAPHNVMVDAKGFLEKHADLTAPAPQFSYALEPEVSTAAKSGAPTATLRLAFSHAFRPAWNYDAAAARYLRLQDGAPDLDAAGTQLSATNVVTLRVPVTHSYGVPKTELIGGGEAWVTSGGGTVHATWKKASAREPIRLLDDSGVTVRLGAGNTWVELVPTEGSVEIVPPAAV